LGDFNETFKSTDVPSLIEKYPKIKYAIFDRPHWRQLDLCETFVKN
jgi:hypothetical protein